MTIGLLIAFALFGALLYSGKQARGSQPFVAGTGYIDTHLVGFRKHVNAVRAGKCLARYRFERSDAYIASLDVGSPQRRFMRLIWKVRHWRAHEAPSRCTPWYITAQIRAGNILGSESAGDPWPNCPDPYDGSGSSWQGTVACENGGQWTDTPGFYRCGLQFHPAWENRFGRLCP